MGLDEIFDPEENPGDFVILAGISISVSDFKVLWEGQHNLPALSLSEFRQLQRGDLNGELRRRIEKRTKTLQLIKDYKTKGITLGEVITSVSKAVLPYDKNLEHPFPREDGMATSVDEQPQTKPKLSLVISLTEETKQQILVHTLNIAPGKDISTVLSLVNSALTGQEVTDGQLKELARYESLQAGQLRENALIVRLSVLFAGVSIGVGAYELYFSKNPHKFPYVEVVLLFVSIILYRHRFHEYRKDRLDFKKYQEFYDEIYKSVDLLDRTPAGKVKMVLLQELVRHEVQTNSGTDITTLWKFIQWLNGNSQREDEFNRMFFSVHKGWDSLEGVLTAISSFEAPARKV